MFSTLLGGRTAGSHLETRALGVLKKLQQAEGGGVAPSAPGGQPGGGSSRVRGARGPRSGGLQLTGNPAGL